MHTTSRRGGLAGRGAAWKTCLLMTIGLCALLLTMPAAPGAVTVTNSTLTSVDGGFFTTTFVVSGASAITDVDILIDFSKCDGPPPGPTETNALSRICIQRSDRLILTSPSGTPVTLLTVATYDDVGTRDRVSVTLTTRSRPRSVVAYSLAASSLWVSLRALSGSQPSMVRTRMGHGPCGSRTRPTMGIPCNSIAPPCVSIKHAPPSPH